MAKPTMNQGHSRSWSWSDEFNFPPPEEGREALPEFGDEPPVVWDRPGRQGGLFRSGCFGCFFPKKDSHPEEDAHPKKHPVSSGEATQPDLDPVSEPTSRTHPSPFVYPPCDDWTPCDYDSIRFTERTTPSIVYVVDGPISDKRQQLPAQPHRWHQSYLSPMSQRPPSIVDRNVSTDTSLTSVSINSSLFMPEELSKPKAVVRTSSAPFAGPRPPRIGRSRVGTTAAELSRPPLPPSRPRANTQESRGSRASTSSATSTHRRNVQFVFTEESLQQINQPNDDDESTIASIDTDLLDGDGCYGSPFQNLQKQHDSWLDAWVEASGDGEKASKISKGPLKKKESEETIQTELVYLPRCDKLEQREKPIVSGWVAFSAGRALCDKLKKSKMALMRKNIAYLLVTDASSSIVLKQDDTKETGEGSAENGLLSIEFSTKNCFVDMETVSPQQGRCIMLKEQRSHRIVCTLMPVSLPPQYFLENGSVIPSGSFDVVSRMSPPAINKTRNQAAPVVQHEASLHLMFALDAWIRGRENEQ